MADPNRTLFESVVHLLAPMLEELVFVGGCSTDLFITDPAAQSLRPTKDVAAIVDVASYAKYAAAAAADVRGYIGTQIRALFDRPDFIEALAGFLLPDRASQARRNLIEGRLRRLSTA